MPRLIVDLGLSREDIVVCYHGARVQKAASRVVGRVQDTSIYSDYIDIVT